MLEALDAVVRGGRQRSAVELARNGIVERVDQQGGLATATNAGNAGEQAERDLGVDVLEIVATRVDHLDGAPLVGRLALGHRHAEFAGEIFTGPGARRGDDVIHRAFGDDVATVNAGTRADVEYVIGAADGVLVVLDHDHGVAEVAQALEGFQQASIVALVQADRRLVENV